MTDIAPSYVPIQQESVQFNQPVSESSLSSIGASINGLLNLLLPVASLIHSELDETQFQTAIGNPSPATWILSDGRDVTGSQFELLTGRTNCTDYRGIFIRGLNNGGSQLGTRSDAYANPDDPSGTFVPGRLTLDKLASHNHTWLGETLASRSTGTTSNTATSSTGLSPSSTIIQATGGNETAPKNGSANVFVRIN